MSSKRRGGGGGRSRAQKESQRLEDEALKMEARLRVLRNQMSQEKKKWESSRPAEGGSRWRSSRTDRGSIRGYGKDVLSGRVPKARSSRRRQGGASASSGGAGGGGGGRDAQQSADGGRLSARRRPASAKKLRQADAETWHADDVVKWLSVLGLTQYQTVFRDNEITGAVLLELGNEDLDYMKINILGHRKMLLKGVEQLRRVVHGEPPQRVLTEAQALHPPAPRTLSPSPRAPTRPPFQSVAPPQPPHKVSASAQASSSEQSKQVSGDAAGGSLADGALDEAAEHAAFTAAVMAWRNGGKAPTETAPGQPTGSDSTAGAGIDKGGMFTNPFAGAGAGGGGGGAGAGAGSLTSASATTAPDGGGALLDGTLDEAAEHAAFRQAVAAWRQGEKEAVNKGSCYQCYRLFYKSSSHQQFTSDSHEFCREECLQAYAVRMKELQKSKAEAEAKSSELARATAEATAATKAAALRGSRLGSPMDVEPMHSSSAATAPATATTATTAPVASAGAAAAAGGLVTSEAQLAALQPKPTRDYSNIWAMDVGF